VIAAYVSPATFERQRARALAAGPSDDAVSDALLNLWADASELTDAMGCLDCARYDELDALRVDALRTGDWSAYGDAWRAALNAELKPRAVEVAREQQERSWRDADEAMADARAA
jgi:hypothetical protein